MMTIPPLAGSPETRPASTEYGRYTRSLSHSPHLARPCQGVFPSMRLLPILAAGLVGCLLAAGPRPAETPPSPLRLIPAEADVLIEVPDPRHIAEVLGKIDVLTEVQKLAFVKEQLDSTSVRRARQLLAYMEKKLGGKWPALLEKLAGGGIALGAKYGNNPPAVLVLQGSDEKLAGQFLDEA